MLSEAKFILQNQELNWSFSLSADDLSLRGIKLPHVAKESAKEHFEQRVAYTKMLNDIIEELYSEYMSLRLTNNFEQEAELIQGWLENKILGNF